MDCPQQSKPSPGDWATRNWAGGGVSRPKTTLTLTLILLLTLLATPAHANSAAAEYFRSRADRSAVPKLLTEAERTTYRDLFAAIKRSDWKQVQATFAQQPDGPLHSIARAEFYLAANSPRTSLDALTNWLATGTDLPQAEQIGNLALKRGALALPPLPPSQTMASLPPRPRRSRPRSIADGTMPASIASNILENIKNDNPDGAKQLLDNIDSALSPEARSEWRQRVAWSFYIGNRDVEAYALAASVGDNNGDSGDTTSPWAAESWWTAGLAAWRVGDCTRSGENFAKSAKIAGNSELAAAAYFWQARSFIRCRQPESASAPLRLAAGYDETLYGMLAFEQLAMKLPAAHAEADFTAADWQSLRDTGNVRRAVALAEIGEDGLADDVLRHQARIGNAAQYQPLTRLARDLGLPSTQLWMAFSAPDGGTATPASRYPTPKWTPVTGWQVDPALIYAHTLEESVFRARAISPAGARGLMQIMPAAARDHAGELGIAGNNTDLSKPEINMAFGQLHLQTLRQSPNTGGLLLKVIAAYNAGPVPIGRWNDQIRDGGDPLLWMESVPYWETRAYISTVLRNYWMYERQAGGPSESRMALAQGQWPIFPTLTSNKSVRVTLNVTPDPKSPPP